MSDIIWKKCDSDWLLDAIHTLTSILEYVPFLGSIKTPSGSLFFSL